MVHVAAVEYVCSDGNAGHPGSGVVVFGQVGPLCAEDLLLGTRVRWDCPFLQWLYHKGDSPMHRGGGESKRPFPYRVHITS